MTIKEILSNGIEILKENNIEDESIISRMLLSYVLDCKKEDLVINLKKQISKKEEKKFLDGIEKISKGYPVQYIIGKREFMQMDFFVNENVLVPRPDTEMLVEEVIKLCREENKKDVLDMCTGSGAIAISLAKNIENTNITASDISLEAINVAKKNAENLLDKQNIEFIQSNMFKKIEGKFDIIVSNPPYIKTRVIDEYILKYEPKLALDGGEDGLRFYRTIIDEGYKYLKPNGVIALEIGYDQKEEIQRIIAENKKYKESYCIKDLGGNDRVLVIKI